jgi:hypothetical protein
MRMWSLHPRYLDAKGIVACWRETLLAQKVLDGRTAGYRSHPQLGRFRAAADPLASIGAYLEGLAVEADRRGYRFNRSLVLVPPATADAGASARATIPVTEGQLRYEWSHLLAKLALRDPARHAELAGHTGLPAAHPLFTPVPGDVEPWEVR